MSISGGHLLDAQVSIGCEIILIDFGGRQCSPGIQKDDISAECIYNQPVKIDSLGAFYNWDKRFWFPSP